MYTGQPNTTMQFANGSTYSMPNIAVVFGNFTGVNSGRAFFQKFCTGPQPILQTPAQPATPSDNSTAAAPATSHIGYPEAELINPNLAVGGYYIDGDGYKVGLT